MFGDKGATGVRGEPMPVEHTGAPDSTNPAGKCPRCGKQSSFDLAGHAPLTFDGGRMHLPGGGSELTYHERATVLICRHCKQGISVLEEKWIGEHKSISSTKGGGEINWRGFHWWPLSGTNSHQAVPKEIADALNEAVLCQAAHCPRAAAVMARRTLEAIATDKGGASSDILAKRLSKMAASGLLPPTLADWAKEVRLVGNTGAHADPIDTVSGADADQLLAFLQALLEYLYVLPFELDQRRAAKP